MHLLAFGINFLPHFVNLILIILFLTLLNRIVSKLICPIISPLSLSITPTLFHCKLKRYLFLKSFLP